MALPTPTPSLYTNFIPSVGAELSYYNRRISITDTTGGYSSGNTTGWGSPNPDISDVTAVTVTILDPSNVTYTFDVTTTTTVVPYPTLPNTASTALVVKNTYIGLTSTDEITDGIYYITYNISGTTSGNDWVKQVITPFLFTAQADCCVQSLQVAVDALECCDCDKTALNNFIEARGYLNAASLAMGCGRVEQAQRLLDKVNWICNLTSCNCN